MRAVLWAAIVAGLSGFLIQGLSRAPVAQACSYLPTNGPAALESALEFSDLIVTGEVIREELDRNQEDTPRSMAQGEITVRVDSVLRGSLTDRNLVFRNERPHCSDPGPRFEVGEYVLLSLAWTPLGVTPEGPVDFRWTLTTFGSKILIDSDEALNDEPWLEPRFTAVGPTVAVIRDLGQRLDLPESQIDAILADQANATGKMNYWYAAGWFALIFVLLFAVSLALKKRVENPRR